MDLQLLIERLKSSFWLVLQAIAQPENRIWWPFLLIAYLIAASYYFVITTDESSIFLRIKKSVQSCFPKDIILHPSAILDYKYFIINGVLYSAFLAPFMVTIASGTVFTELFAEKIYGDVSEPLEVTFLFYVVMTLLVALADDFGRYWSHWLHHRIPALWNMHKVHHTATVMTPITLYRVHPIELFLHGSAAGILAGLVFGIGRFLTAGELTTYEILNMNIIIFAAAIIGSNLRHSHVWIRYPDFISKIIMSPAQHQVHHSRLKEHHDKNLGSALSLWDWLFGTLYIPKKDEKLEFGITSRKETAEFSTIKNLYWLPIAQTFRTRVSDSGDKRRDVDQKSKDKET